MSNPFGEVMAGKTNVELLEIITVLQDDYQAEALEAANQELKNRNLSDSDREIAEQDLAGKQDAIVAREEEPLDPVQKILFAVFCWGIIPWAMAGTFKTSGYRRKYKQAWKSMYIGIGLYTLLFIISLVSLL